METEIRLLHRSIPPLNFIPRFIDVYYVVLFHILEALAICFVSHRSFMNFHTLWVCSLAPQFRRNMLLPSLGLEELVQIDAKVLWWTMWVEYM
jgi:hypothetical protein